MDGRAALAAVLLPAALLATQQSADYSISPDLLRLARIKVVMSDHLSRLPNYTCQQTIERSRRRARSQRFELVDTLRLEVALVGGKELFAWPGGDLDERELGDFVGGGAIGTGTFGLHARAVFLSSAPVFTYRGEVDVDGGRAFVYDYRVAQINSGFHLKMGDRSAVVGYHGRFLVRTDTLDLLRLEVHADDIPPHLGLAAAGETILYRRMRIGDGDFLLPASSELRMRDLSGNESRNRTSFSACRQYTGESVLSFAEPEMVATQAPAPPKEVEVPAGLLLDLRLEAAIRYGSTAVGDPLRARLASDVKHKGKLILPKGALVLGRLTRLERSYARDSHYIVGLRFDTIEFGDSRASFCATLESVGLPVSWGPPPILVEEGRNQQTAVSQAVFRIRASRDAFAGGLRLLWRTEAATKRNLR